MRAHGLALLTIAALLAVTGTATAGTVGIDGDTLHYEASPGEFNELNVMLQGASSRSRTAPAVRATRSPSQRGRRAGTTTQRGLTRGSSTPTARRRGSRESRSSWATGTTTRESARWGPPTTHRPSTGAKGRTGSSRGPRPTTCTAVPAP